MINPTKHPLVNPGALVSIARNANQTGDVEQLRIAKKLLREQFGIELRFVKMEEAARA
ncbi:hypothetical protein [Rosistilla oblonga]|uniref:hypothetical protein n=1 Tax=Rosistilla oblonga TaxID=2527990 RepID=UPI003A97303C